MSVPLVRHLHQLSTYITVPVRRNRKILPPQFKNKFSAGQKMYYGSGPLLARVFCEQKSQKNSFILLSSHATAQEDEVQGIHGENSQIKLNILTSYNKKLVSISTLQA
jgi:hypothetical protein